MKRLPSKQHGFTLVELIVVIILIGILAAVAAPRFVDLKGDAYNATAQGYAGALNSANAINYSGCAAKAGVATAGVCVKITTCEGIGVLLQPPITITTTGVPATTVAGVFYSAASTPSTATGATCTAVYGDGAAGRSFTFYATTT